MAIAQAVGTWAGLCCPSLLGSRCPSIQKYSTPRALGELALRGGSCTGEEGEPGVGRAWWEISGLCLGPQMYVFCCKAPPGLPTIALRFFPLFPEQI